MRLENRHTVGRQAVTINSSRLPGPWVFSIVLEASAIVQVA